MNVSALMDKEFNNKKYEGIIEYSVLSPKEKLTTEEIKNLNCEIFARIIEDNGTNEEYKTDNWC